MDIGLIVAVVSLLGFGGLYGGVAKVVQITRYFTESHLEVLAEIRSLKKEIERAETTGAKQYEIEALRRELTVIDRQVQINSAAIRDCARFLDNNTSFHTRNKDED